MPDYRLQWIEDNVYEHLELSHDLDPYVFETFLYSNGGENYNRMNLFLTKTRDDCDIAVAFYKGIHEEFEEVEVEIGPDEWDEEEQMVDIANGQISQNASKDDVVKSETSLASYVNEAGPTTKVVKKKKKEKGKAKANLANAEAAARARAAAAAEAAAAEAAAASEEEEQPRTKIIMRSIRRTYIYMVSGIDLSFEIVSMRPCLFFIRRYMEGAIPEVRDKPGQIKIMQKHFEVALMHGDGLNMLDELLGEVYQPLLAYFEHRQSYIIEEKLNLFKKANAAVDDDDDDELGYDQYDETGSSHGSEEDTARKTLATAALRDEFLISMRKFKGAFAVAFGNLSRKVKLIIPSNVIFNGTDDEYLLNDKLQKIVEKTCIVWYSQVQVNDCVQSTIIFVYISGMFNKATIFGEIGARHFW